ncbi:MAG: single-stranded DNA-binding protein [Clostridium sp.]|nr:single-stranded DNA-binding protein [Clostridium sp.]
MLNVTVLMGRLVADPELRHTQSDVAVTSFTIAVDRSYVKSGADRQADFIDIVAWRGTADFVCKYFRKGQMIAVQGSIQTRSYQDKDGNKRKAFEIVADNVHFAEPKRDGDSHGGNRAAAASQRPDVGADDFDEIPASDDLPF